MTLRTSVLPGAQSPRLRSVPPFSASAGDEAVELAAAAGLLLDPWQRDVLRGALAEREDGGWSTFEVGVVVPRQNGKGAILEARELAGLFLFGERLILHSAHEFRTAVEAFLRILQLIESTPDLDHLVKKVSRSHGDEGIELKSGARLNFVARTGGSGRGLSADTVILDEAFNLPDAAISALMPTMSARENPQIWYTSSAVNAEEHRNGWVLTRLRNRALAGEDPSLAYFEWSADEERYKADPDAYALDEQAWAEANPGLGMRIPTDHVQNEQRTMAPKPFAVERLGIGDWPKEADASSVFGEGAWEACIDLAAVLPESFALAADAPPDRSEAYVAAAGVGHVEITETKRGLGWVFDYLAEKARKHNCTVAIDGRGALAGLIPKLEDAGVRVLTLNASDVAKGCGQFYDAVVERRLSHLDDPMLNLAVNGATQRPLGDAWAWDRKSATVSISPLIAATNALYAASSAPAPGPFNVYVF